MALSLLGVCLSPLKGVFPCGYGCIFVYTYLGTACSLAMCGATEALRLLTILIWNNMSIRLANSRLKFAVCTAFHKRLVNSCRPLSCTVELGDAGFVHDRSQLVYGPGPRAYGLAGIVCDREDSHFSAAWVVCAMNGVWPLQPEEPDCH